VILLVKSSNEIYVVALKRAVSRKHNFHDLLGAGVLGDSLGSFTDGVLGKLTREQQTHSGLDLPASDGGTLVVVSETASFSGNALEDVVDKTVHDAHGLAGNTGVGVNLLQYLVDVDSIALLTLLPASLLIRLRDVLLGLARFLGGLSTCLGRHVCNFAVETIIFFPVTGVFNL
jgi:hypothetical protein